jgi:hypothetical protein
MENPCDRVPDKKRKLDGGISVHTYLKVPVNEAAVLLICRRKDPGFWNDDVFQDDSTDTCTVLVYYKAP